MNNENDFETNMNEEPPKKKKKFGVWKVFVVIGLAIVFGLVATVTFYGAKYAIDNILKLDTPKMEQAEETQIGKTEIETESGVSVVSASH